MSELYTRQSELEPYEAVSTDNPLAVKTVGATTTEDGYLYLSIPTQTTTTVKSAPGNLRRIVIPTQVASATVKIYDNVAGSGTVILETLTLPATLLSEGPFVIELGIAFLVGLTIVTAGATMPLTVVYR